MPESVLAFGVVPSEELDGGILVDGAHGIPFRSVHFGYQHVTRQAFAQALGDIQRRDAGFILSDTLVREGYVNHRNSHFESGCKSTNNFLTKRRFRMFGKNIFCRMVNL